MKLQKRYIIHVQNSVYPVNTHQMIYSLLCQLLQLNSSLDQGQPVTHCLMINLLRYAYNMSMEFIHLCIYIWSLLLITGLWIFMIQQKVVGEPSLLLVELFYLEVFCGSCVFNVDMCKQFLICQIVLTFKRFTQTYLSYPSGGCGWFSTFFQFYCL